jgi:hypothetical protein
MRFTLKKKCDTWPDEPALVQLCNACTIKVYNTFNVSDYTTSDDTE